MKNKLLRGLGVAILIWLLMSIMTTIPVYAATTNVSVEFTTEEENTLTSTSEKSEMVDTDVYNFEIEENYPYTYVLNKDFASFIYASYDGSISSVGETSLTVNYGDIVVYYQGVSSYDLKKGDTVKSGDIIASSTTNAFSVLVRNDSKILPTKFLFSEFDYTTNGMLMPVYKQEDESWGDLSYSTSTISKSGCGPSAFAMVVSYLKGEEITTPEIVDVLKNSNINYYVPGAGSAWDIFEYLSTQYDLVSTQISISEKSIIDEVRNGNPVILSLSEGPVYTGEGHFIVISGVSVDETKFLVNDSANYFNRNQYYTYEELGLINGGWSFVNIIYED